MAISLYAIVTIDARKGAFGMPVLLRPNQVRAVIAMRQSAAALGLLMTATRLHRERAITASAAPLGLEAATAILGAVTTAALLGRGGLVVTATMTAISAAGLGN